MSHKAASSKPSQASQPPQLEAPNDSQKMQIQQTALEQFTPGTIQNALRAAQRDQDKKRKRAQKSKEDQEKKQKTHVQILNDSNIIEMLTPLNQRTRQIMEECGCGMLLSEWKLVLKKSDKRSKKTTNNDTDTIIDMDAIIEDAISSETADTAPDTASDTASVVDEHE